MSVGFLMGKKKKWHRSRHPVWHFTIPDIMRENIDWREQHHKISERIDFKEKFSEQKEN